jgi:hypothetical protein
LVTLYNRSGRVKAVAFSRDGKRLATGDTDGWVHVSYAMCGFRGMAISVPN